MKTIHDLDGKLSVNMPPLHDDTKRLIAAGPLSKQPMTLPFRVVLVTDGEKLIVWNEVLPNWPDDTTNGHFLTGSYFSIEELDKATERFAQRVADKASTLRSIYREM